MATRRKVEMNGTPFLITKHPAALRHLTRLHIPFFTISWDILIPARCQLRQTYLNKLKLAGVVPGSKMTGTSVLILQRETLPLCQASKGSE